MILVLAGMIWLAANIGFLAGITFKMFCDHRAELRRRSGEETSA